MTDEILYTGQLKRAELPAFIKECGFRTETPTGKTTYFLAENQPEHVIEQSDRQDLLVFDRFKPDLRFDTYKKYTSGRIFSEQGELRWENQNEQVRVIYLGDPSFAAVKQAVGVIYLSKFREKNAELKRLGSPRERRYYLFGTKLDAYTIERINGEQTKNPVKSGDFAELRIHRILRYPDPGHIQAKDYVQLQVQEYIDPDSGRVQLFRFQGLCAEQDLGKERAR
jgi:hypothetical protein